jgi:hypothetical protein
VAVAVCNSCDRYYVIERCEERPPQCPRCHESLRLAGPEETQMRLHRPLTQPGPRLSDPLGARHSDVLDLGSLELGQQSDRTAPDWTGDRAVYAMGIVQESKKRREELAGRLRQVRHLRNQLMELVGELHRTADRMAVSSPLQERAPCGSDRELTPR